MQDAQKKAVSEPKDQPVSELGEPQWAVVSFQKCEAVHLTFAEASAKLAELEAARVPGLCLVTDDVAARLTVKA